MIINEDLIELNMSCHSKEEAIEKMTKMVLLENRLNTYQTCGINVKERTEECLKRQSSEFCYDVFYNSVMDREKLSTTGIGFNIAIPHGKSCAVSEPTVAFARLTKGVDWDSLDGEPVQIVFLLSVPIASSSNEHLKILAALSRKLMHEDFKGKLFHITDKREMFNLLQDILTINAS